MGPIPGSSVSSAAVAALRSMRMSGNVAAVPSDYRTVESSESRGCRQAVHARNADSTASDRIDPTGGGSGGLHEVVTSLRAALTGSFNGPIGLRRCRRRLDQPSPARAWSCPVSVISPAPGSSAWRDRTGRSRTAIPRTAWTAHIANTRLIHLLCSSADHGSCQEPPCGSIASLGTPMRGNQDRNLQQEEPVEQAAHLHQVARRLAPLIAGRTATCTPTASSRIALLHQPFHERQRMHGIAIVAHVLAEWLRPVRSSPCAPLRD